MKAGGHMRFVPGMKESFGHFTTGMVLLMAILSGATGPK